MADWQTTPPPMDREIEFETDAGQIQRGQLAYSGKFGMGSAKAPPNDDAMRDQFMIKGGELEMFEVKRWREIEA